MINRWPTPPISVQLWSLHEEILETMGWEPTLERLAEAGFASVEPFGVAQTRHLFEPAVRRLGLTTPSAHGEMVSDDQRRETIGAAAELGVKLLMQPMFPAERWADRDSVRRIADDLNAAAEIAGAHGMRIAFHNHDDEVRTQIDGRAALLEVFDHVGPGVGVEFDPNWATIGGADVPALIEELGERIFAFHLKDGPAVGGSNADQVAVGDGELDWPRFLAMVPDVPRVIGLDLFAGDTLDAVLRSRQWLLDNDPATR
ncbi:sugar phosphate isomerase/epimerase family protein [Aestuariimicrobium ganziense]|uniref:sugar phosphate isomerase/epimerase family protein n=1 Tax=Aestuariimicrobium ganziense TaxID=2773677 RepID=UPI0019425FE2|nr:sugar phosphate isomerase/epimerase family protein [Aestuariimicrobium ganziense]